MQSYDVSSAVIFHVHAHMYYARSSHSSVLGCIYMGLSVQVEKDLS